MRMVIVLAAIKVISFLIMDVYMILQMIKLLHLPAVISGTGTLRFVKNVLADSIEMLIQSVCKFLLIAQLGITMKTDVMPATLTGF